MTDLDAIAGEIAALRAEVRGLRELLDTGRPVVGLRAAARVLRIGRAKLQARIEELPAHTRPAIQPRADGSARTTYWWPSVDACRVWWEDLHTAPLPPARDKGRKKRPDVVGRLTGSLDDALRQLQRERR